MNYANILPRLPRFFERQPTQHLSHLTHEQYADIPAINASVLKSVTALDMLHAMQDPEDKPEKECFNLGQNLHCAALEPDRWQASIATVPADAPKRPTERQRTAKKPSAETVAAVNWWADFEAKHAGKTLLDQEELDQVEQMSEALRRHHLIRKLLDAPGYNETTVTVWDQDWQVMRKARFDKLPGKMTTAGGHAIPSFALDIKTTSANIHSDYAIRAEILKWGYHLQARWYLDILALALDEPPRDRFYFAFVTNKPPYKARLYELNINTPGDNLLNDAGDILYQAGEHTVGRLPMFIDAAYSFLDRIRDHHPDPLGAWTAYEHEGARIVEDCTTNKNRE